MKGGGKTNIWIILISETSYSFVDEGTLFKYTLTKGTYLCNTPIMMSPSKKLHPGT